jgi:site-specific DNA-methyltransferase (adenine-specific)
MLMRTDSLRPYLLNKELFDSLPKEDYQALKEDIKKNGIKTELHITKSNTILCGHQRWNIAKELGFKEVPCKIVNIDESDELKVKEYVILDNVLRRHLTTEQKYLLIAELSKIYEIGRGGDRKTEDFKKDKLSSMNEDVLTKTAKATGVNEKTVQRAREYSRIVKEAPELKKEKVSVAMAKVRKEKHIEKIKEEVKELSAEEMGIYEGDCLEQLDKVKDNTVSCLIIDPPYGIDFQSNHKLAKYDKIEYDNKEAFSLLDKSLKKVQSKMLKDSHIYIFTSWKVFQFVKPIIEKYFEVKNTLIWNKNNWSMGDLQGNYAEKYEMIIFASQGNRNLLGDKRPVNVLNFERTTNSNHPTEKPVNLLKELIKNSTVEGELILDYFAGSGSTLLASKDLNRKFIGIEKEKDYIDIIKNRLK